MGNSTFTCHLCWQTHEYTIQDEADAQLELSENFFGFSSDQCEMVCDDCYSRFLAKFFKDADEGDPE